MSLYVSVSPYLLCLSPCPSLSRPFCLCLSFCVCQKFCHVEVSGEREVTVGDKLLQVYKRGQEGPTVTYSLNPYSERHKSKLS